MRAHNLDVFFQLKRKIYLGLIPLGFAGFFLYWSHHELNRLDVIALPCLLILLLLDLIIVYRYVRFIHSAELLTLVILGLYHVMKFFMYTNMDPTADFYMLWSPLYYVIIFIAYPRKGLLYSLIFYFITVLLWVISGYAHEQSLLYQLYLSNFSFIIAFYFIRELLSSYTESLQMKSFAFEDHLTNIGNRRMLDYWINAEIIKSNETNNMFSIIYFDIDNFKQVNDTFGHELGDNVLKEITDVVKSNIREEDYFGRWGGEEFIVVVKNQDMVQSEQLAERLRQKIESNKFPTIGAVVTSSFGVTPFKEKDSVQTILERADLALYSAKENGKNRVVTK